MYSRLKSYFQPVVNLNIGNQLFLYGTFFLPSATFIGISLLFVALIISIRRSKTNYLKDKWNYPLLISIGLILFSTIHITFFNNPYTFENFDTKIIWLNLLKWVTLIICFIGFQDFLENYKQRKFFAKFLVAGTLPVILSCFLHKFFFSEGPYQIFNGLIIWFQKPLHISGGISGLFSNVNYTGIWLSITLPFCIVLCRLEKKKLFRYILYFLILLFSYFILETTSRNAYLSLIICFTLFMQLRYSIILILIQATSLVIFKFVEVSENNLYGINFNIPFVTAINEISSSSINLEGSRLVIFKEALSLIRDRPFLGWGPSTFNFNFTKNNLNNLNILKENPYHSHNMPLELAYNFGIPLALILVTTSIILLIISVKNLYKYKFIDKKEFLINKAWIISILIIIFTHLNDVTFYEDRIGIMISIFFSGLRCITKENRLTYLELKAKTDTNL